MLFFGRRSSFALVVGVAGFVACAPDGRLVHNLNGAGGTGAGAGAGGDGGDGGTVTTTSSTASSSSTTSSITTSVSSSQSSTDTGSGAGGSTSCGDGVLDIPGGEECDGVVPDGVKCAKAGTVSCDPKTCKVDYSQCEAVCGNPFIEKDEECETTNLQGAKCKQGGQVSCDSKTCKVNYSKCDATCGNALIEKDEDCDDDNLGGHSCPVGGTLKCKACRFDYSECNAQCGNTFIEKGEECDGSNLNDETCKSLGNPKDGGSLSCAGCKFDLSGCPAYCGDHVKNGDEDCDYLALTIDDSVCVNGGTPTCTTGDAGCKFDVTTCKPICGDGILQKGDGTPAQAEPCDTKLDPPAGKVCVAVGNDCKLFPDSCFNKKQDADEVGLDCGPTCLTCDWGAQAATSCGAPLNTCGINGDENCCTSPAITGGTFKRRYYSAGKDGNTTWSENPPDPNGLTATVQRYHLDKFEVTVGRFRRFLDAYDKWRQAGNPTSQAGANPKQSGVGQQSGWGTVSSGFPKAKWDASLPATAATLANTIGACSNAQASALSTLKHADTSAAQEAVPVNCVSWYEAFAFCIWDGGRLPTEAEWNLAALGSKMPNVTTITRYPWGNEFPQKGTHGNFGRVFGDGADNLKDAFPTTNGFANAFSRVGSFPKGAGASGNQDMAGNVSEWTLDIRWDPKANYISIGCLDCTELQDDTSVNHVEYPHTATSGPNMMLSNAVHHGAKGAHVASIADSTDKANGAPDLTQTSLKGSATPDSHLAFFGFRCARD